MSKRIAIIGGGYIGAELAKSLDNTAEVTLIEPRSHFVHAPAMIRAVVDPALLDRALIPYDRLLKNGRVLRARANGIDADGVTLDDGQRVAADYIVVATGSSNATPFKPVGDDIDGLRQANQRVHDQLALSDRAGVFYVRRSCLKADDMSLIQLEFQRVFDRDDPLVLRDRFGEGAEKRGLAGTRSARDEHAFSMADCGVKELAHLRRHRARSFEFDRPNTSPTEATDREGGAVGRDGR